MEMILIYTCKPVCDSSMLWLPSVQEIWLDKGLDQTKLPRNFQLANNRKQYCYHRLEATWQPLLISTQSQDCVDKRTTLLDTRDER